MASPQKILVLGIGDRRAFKREILPRLKGIPLRKIHAATGLSLQYSSLIRRGLYIPHARHWQALRSL